MLRGSFCNDEVKDKKVRGARKEITQIQAGEAETLV